MNYEGIVHDWKIIPNKTLGDETMYVWHDTLKLNHYFILNKPTYVASLPSEVWEVFSMIKDHVFKVETLLCTK